MRLLTDLEQSEWPGRRVMVKRMTHPAGVSFMYQAIVMEVAKPNPKRKGLPRVKLEPLFKRNGKGRHWRDVKNLELLEDLK